MHSRSIALILIALAMPAEARRPTDLYVGTGGWPHTSGMTSPAATTPFGLVRLGPDTKAPFPYSLIGAAYSTAGYGYADHKLFGFSHTRLSGTGVRDGGAFRVLPTTHAAKVPNAVAFHHWDEKIEPGAYQVLIRGEKVRAELTASPHCGFHRYHRTRSRRALALSFDVTSRLAAHAEPTGARLRIEGQTLSGQSRTQGEFASRQGGLLAYFYAEVSRPFAVDPAMADISTDGDLKAMLNFDSAVDEVELKLCVSYVSTANAKLNFEAEARDVGFDQARARAKQAWDDYFDRASIQTRDQDFETLFYSMLYLSSLMPTQFSDVNGEYLDFGKQVRVAQGFTYRTDLSLWDTFRTAHPLYTLIAPEIMRDSALSLMSMASVRGIFPRWAFAAGDAGSMFGSPANFVMSEAYLKGVRDFDPALAVRYMHTGASASDYTREAACREHGYCPSDQVSKSVSKTLEYAWSDFAAAELAHAAGLSDEEAWFREREVAFRGVWDPSTRFFRPKDSLGKFTRFNPRLTSYFSFMYKPATAYAEGGPHHYRYSAPHHAQELIELFGGREAFVQELDQFMMGASPRMSAINPGPRYWHGNEHDLHALYLFNEAGRPDLTQEWARWALRERYATAPNGLDGNDDGGTLSAWFVLSALGLYPQAGTDRYWIGSPGVDHAQLNLGAGHSLEITAIGQSWRNVYVSELRVNGKRWCQSSIRHAELMDARLEFVMSRKPARTFECAEIAE